MSTKQCSRCRAVLPLEAFNLGPGSHGRKSQCKLCKWVYTQSPEAKERHRQREGKRAKEYPKTGPKWRDKRLGWKYGITEVQFQEILAQQNGQCGICKTDTPGGFNNQFHVDHDHDTLKVRGLLCMRCNMALGLLNDSIQSLQNAVEYMQRANEPKT